MSPHATQDTVVPTGTNNWWKEATVYQVSCENMKVFLKTQY